MNFLFSLGAEMGYSVKANLWDHQPFGLPFKYVIEVKTILKGHLTSAFHANLQHMEQHVMQDFWISPLCMQNEHWFPSSFKQRLNELKDTDKER